MVSWTGDVSFIHLSLRFDWVMQTGGLTLRLISETPQSALLITTEGKRMRMHRMQLQKENFTIEKIKYKYSANTQSFGRE